MSQVLFRKQVVESQSDRLCGEVLLQQPLSYRLMTTGLLAMVLAIGVYLCLGSYARKETVYGYIKPENGVIKVYSQREGVVSQVFVREGDRVKADAPLFVIKRDHVLGDGRNFGNVLLQEYEIQASVYDKKIDRLPITYRIRRKLLQEQLNSVRGDIGSLDNLLVNLDERLLIQTQRFEKNTNLAKQKMLAASQLELLQQQVLELQAQRGQLQRSRQQQIHMLNQHLLSLEQIPLEELETKENYERELSDVTQQIAQINERQSFIVKAHKSGIVSGIEVALGELIRSNQPLTAIVPNDSNLEAELMVPANAIGFVEPGQLVKLRYSAYPYQKFGIYDGRIKYVSKHILMPHELPNNPNSMFTRSGNPGYRVTVELGSQSVTAFGKILPLKQGIQLEADIRLSDRSLIQWLLEPIFSLKGRL